MSANENALDAVFKRVRDGYSLGRGHAYADILFYIVDIMGKDWAVEIIESYCKEDKGEE